VVPALYVRERVRSLRRGGDIEPLWEAELLVGAVAELTSKSATLRNAVGDAEFRGLLPDGATTDLDE
jgi:hypothetical protein